MKNKHLTHVEDLILTEGLQGGRKAINLLNNVTQKLAGINPHLIINLKWDGSPAIVCGIDPETKKFFVGTKSVFNSISPKLFFSASDIDEHYGNRSDLALKLRTALEHFPELGMKGVYQGDLLYTKKDLSTTNIDGIEYIEFTPNTITYAIPRDSFTGRLIERSKVGVVFHTKYEGTGSLSNREASFEVRKSEFVDSSNVWLNDGFYDHIIIESTPCRIEETKRIHELLTNAIVVIDELERNANEDYQTFLALPKMQEYLQRLINKIIKNSNTTALLDIDRYQTELIALIHNEISNYAKTLKTDAGRAKQYALRQSLIESIDRYDFVIDKIMTFQRHISEAKRIILLHLNRTHEFDTRFEGDQIPHEGFVIIDKINRDVIKLVDRFTFSKLNFNRHNK